MNIDDMYDEEAMLRADAEESLTDALEYIGSLEDILHGKVAAQDDLEERFAMLAVAYGKLQDENVKLALDASENSWRYHNARRDCYAGCGLAVQEPEADERVRQGVARWAARWAGEDRDS